MTAYSPNVEVSARHYMSVHIDSPATYISLYRGMDAERVRQASGADRQNCKESFTIGQTKDGRYKLTHHASALPKAQRVRGVTGTAARIDEVLQRFVNSTLEQV